MRLRYPKVVGDLAKNTRGGKKIRGRLSRALGAAEPWPKLRRLPDYTNRSVAPLTAAKVQVGRYKYTSGMIKLPYKLQRQFGASRFAIKLYTDSQCRFNNQRLMTELKRQHRPQSLTSGLRESMQVLAKVAKHALEAAASGRHVFAQIIKAPQELEFLPATSYRQAIRAIDRTWSLILEMDVDGSRSSPLSVPYVTLGSLGMNFPLHKYLRQAPPSFVGHANMLKIDICGLLRDPRASIWHGNTSDNDSVQSVFDGLIDDIYKSSHRKTYGTVESLVVAVRDTLVMSFRSSPLAKYLYLANVEVTIEGAGRQRVASSRLYRSDRPVPPPRLLVKPQESRELIVDGVSRNITLHATYASQRHTQLSDEVAQKLCVSKAQVVRKSAEDHEHPLSRMDEGDIVRQLERLCIASDKIGLDCLADVSTSLSNALHLDQGTALELRLSYFDPKRLHVNNTTVTVVMETPLQTIYEIGFPLDRTIPLRARDQASDGSALVLQKVIIRGRVKPWFAPESAQDQNMAGEVLHLSNIAAATIDKVCGAVDFPDIRTGGASLVEAVLRTARFLTPSFEVHSADLVFRDPHEVSMWKSTAAWTGDPIPIKCPESSPAGPRGDAISAAPIRSSGASSQLFHCHGVSLSDELRRLSGIRTLRATMSRGTEVRQAAIETMAPKQLDGMQSGDIAAFNDLYLRLSKELQAGERLELRLKVDRGKFQVLDYYTAWSNVTLLDFTPESLQIRLAQLPRIPVFIKRRYGAKPMMAELTTSVQGSRPGSSDRPCIEQLDAILMQCAAILKSHIDGRTFQSSDDLVAKYEALLREHRTELSQELKIEAASVKVTLSEWSGESSESRTEALDLAPIPARSNTASNAREEDGKHGAGSPDVSSGTTAQSDAPSHEGSHMGPHLHKRNRTEWRWEGALPLVFEHRIDHEQGVVNAEDSSVTPGNALECLTNDIGAAGHGSESELVSEQCGGSQSSTMAKPKETTASTSADEDLTSRKQSISVAASDEYIMPASHPAATSDRTGSGDLKAADERTDLANTADGDTTSIGYVPVPKERGVVIALGSNMGDRVAEIERACREIDADPDMRIVDTSCLYETDAMYVEDQDRFINGACEIETTLEPMELLDRLQAIENRMGRVKLIDKGPRNIDLDVALYRGEIVRTKRLTIPHALMMEREFVLRPLLDIKAIKAAYIPGTKKPVFSALKGLYSKGAIDARMDTITPLSQDEALHCTNPHRRTRIMSILNTTPDSFSDGGVNLPSNGDALRATAAAHIAAGASIIDVGGQSSRPGAPDVTAEEEIARVLPAIEAIKSLPESGDIAISVDTYRAIVAEAAIKAGAHIVNDISAGCLDPDMLATVARLGCTYIMMHMRGTPATMNSAENCTYAQDEVRKTVQDELTCRVDAAIAAGVRRWRIITDPGIGFAKTQGQNLELLRDLTAWSAFRPFKTLPTLVGTSRKKFIGNITGVEEAKDRSWGTAATVTQAVNAGADIVRVHDVKEMAQVVKMADAMYRVPPPKDWKV